LRAVSRQIHGTAGTFDIDLPLSGGPGIECRKSTNQSGLYTVVLTFSDPLVRVDQAVFEFPDPGQGTEIFGDIDSADTHNYIITLFVGFTPRIINMALHNVVDSAGDFSARVPISMGLLIGDVNATGRTDSGDVTAVRNRTISIPDQQTCRFDVNLDGRIDSGDVTVTRNASVTVLP
jgi:hypothetical protein